MRICININDCEYVQKKIFDCIHANKNHTLRYTCEVNNDQRGHSKEICKHTFCVSTLSQKTKIVEWRVHHPDDDI